ncbi:MAG TPA: type II secretion system F family protein [Pseudonocardiaceae bacterium]|nr:type II secretion system F family protein [Pseudonocardiaceae bacterium]
MLSLAMLALAAATLCWPRLTAIRRLPVLGPAATGRPIRPARWRLGRFGWVITLISLTTLALALGGIGVAVAMAASGTTALRRRRARRLSRERLMLATGMADALRAIVAELRAGAHPAAAAEGGAAEAPGPVASVLTAVARAARLGGDIGAAVSEVALADPAGSAAVRMVARPLVRAWSLANRHGLPLANVLDSVRGDVVARVRFARQVHARMAGPRASGAILAVLPVLGVLLGEGMGADPVHVLLATSAGHLLLVVGVVLACAGTLWIGRLTAQVAMADPAVADPSARAETAC